MKKLETVRQSDLAVLLSTGVAGQFLNDLRTNADLADGNCPEDYTRIQRQPAL